jgi:F-type H+-transporting ATPase subunit epsilon
MSLIFDCTVLTPEKTMYEGKAEFTVVQLYDGEMGFLPGHIPFIGELGIGEMRVMNQNQIDRMVIEGGIVEFFNNKITILAENVLMKKDLNAVKLQEDLKKLLDTDDEAYSGSFKDIEKQKFKARIKVALRP